MEIRKEHTIKENIIIGILIGTTFTVKQSIGCILICLDLLYNVLTVKKKEDITRISIKMLSTCGILICYVTMLFLLGALKDYIDYCIIGVTTFSNKITYFNGLIKSSNILIRVLSIIPFFLYLAILFIYKKNKDKKLLIILTYSLISFTMIYPISDEAHFVVAIPETLICIGYVLNYISEKIQIPVKEEVITTNFLESFIVLATLLSFFIGINSFCVQNKNMQIKHFKYLPLDEDGINNINEIDEFILKQKKEVYILDSTACLYMIPIDRYNKDFDLFNKGNLGGKGEERTNRENKKNGK